MTQSAFITALMDPYMPAPPQVQTPDGRPTTKRFNVYRNNVIAGLVEALGAGFPALKALVGVEFFSAMAPDFIRAHPPRSQIIALYGAEFATFLETFPPAQSLPYLSDIARLEYAMRESYHAADSASVPPQALSDPTLLSRPVTLAPSLRVVASPYPIKQIYDAAFGGAATHGAGEDVLITRPDFDPRLTAFPNGTARIIDALAAGNTLEAALTLAPPALNIPDFISALVTGGALTHIGDLP